MTLRYRNNASELFEGSNEKESGNFFARESGTPFCPLCDALVLSFSFLSGEKEDDDKNAGLLVGDTPFVVSSVNGFSCRRRGFGGDQEEGSLKNTTRRQKMRLIKTN